MLLIVSGTKLDLNPLGHDSMLLKSRCGGMKTKLRKKCGACSILCSKRDVTEHVMVKPPSCLDKEDQDSIPGQQQGSTFHGKR